MPANAARLRPPAASTSRLAGECERLGIVTRDPGAAARFRDLEKAARSSLPILLAGEPGTGKELFARAAHRLSPARRRPFVAVNMAAIPAELFESEMFGHVRGSFTGAVADRKGYFEQAGRGTIFLDEVGELRPEHQSKLLRVLQDKSFNRVGASRPTTVDVRVVAASNRDLEHGVAEGWFREDLYFRLKGLVLRLPPLRERTGDVPLLAARSSADAAAEIGRAAAPADGVRVRRRFERGDWPATCARCSIVSARPWRSPTTRRSVGRPPAPRPREPARPRDTGPEEAVTPPSSPRSGSHAFDMQATARALGWDRSTVTQRLKGLGFRALVESGRRPGTAPPWISRAPRRTLAWWR